MSEVPAPQAIGGGPPSEPSLGRGRGWGGRWIRWAPFGAILVAALATVSRWPMRWGPIPLAYAAYFHELRWAIRDEGWWAAATTWIGLHPPGYGVVMLLAFAAEAPPAALLLGSGLLSVVSLWFVGRTLRAGHWVVAPMWILALDPIRVAYSLEVNNYPLLAFVSAFGWWSIARVLDDGGAAQRAEGGAHAAVEGPARRPWSAALRRLGGLGPRPSGGRSADHLLVAVSSTVLLWTHVLAWPQAILGVLVLLTRRSWWCAGVIVGAMPLVPGLLGRAASPSINERPGVGRAVVETLLGSVGRYSPAPADIAILALLCAALVVGWRRGPLLRLVAVQVTGTWLGLVALSAAGYSSIGQHPYHHAMMVGSAILVGELLRPAGPSALRFESRVRHALLAVVVVLSIGRLAAYSKASAAAWGSWSLAGETHPLVAEGVRRWVPGTVLVIVAPPWYGDDDKDVVEPAWALLSPWTRLRARDPGLPEVVASDPYWGQPWATRDGRWWYTFAAWDGARIEHLLREHGRVSEPVVVVFYGGQTAPDQWEAARHFAKARGEGASAEWNDSILILSGSTGADRGSEGPQPLVLPK